MRPRGLPGEGDLFYRNLGDGRFEEVGAKVGVDDPHKYFGLGIAWFDADEDGWLDLFVTNDAGPNFLYMNQKDGTFKDNAFPAGVAVSEDGAEQGNMGVAVGDYENAGRFSLFSTTFAEEYNAFYRNAGSYFMDWSFRTKTAPSSLPFVGWGTAFLDYDNDGWQDIIVGNGHVYPQLDQAKLGRPRPTGSGGCCTTAAATGPSRRWPSSTGRLSPSRGSAGAWRWATSTTTAGWTS